MEAIRTTNSGTSTPRSRRSFPNLQQLSLAPLSSRFPLDDDSVDDAFRSPEYISTPRSSYIAGKSAPTTPGILERAPETALPTHSEHGRKRHVKMQNQERYAHDGGYFPSVHNAADFGDISKAKSTSILAGPPGYVMPKNKEMNVGRHHRRSGTGGLRKVALQPLATSQGNDEWITRAGIAIASGARESKGQSWIVSRDSSTSLVQQSEVYNDGRSQVLLSGASVRDGDGDGVLRTPKYSYSISRVGSRLPSARGSRAGSRAGSRVELSMAGQYYIPDINDYMEDALAEPDFIDPPAEDTIDEEEVARLAKERGFGLGGWVDSLVGWSLFKVSEDGDEDGDDDEQEEENEAEAIQRREEARKWREERAAATTRGASDGADPPPPPANPEDGEGGWKDAAWLLSVASKIIL